MKSGYKILWTNHAISELEKTLEYLENNWTERELRTFSVKLDHTIELISKSPNLSHIFREKEYQKGCS